MFLGGALRNVKRVDTSQRWGRSVRRTVRRIAMRIGIASGPVFVGQAGVKRGAASVGVGATARRAVRLQGMAVGMGVSLSMDDATKAALRGRVETAAGRDVGSGKATAVHASK